MVSVDRLGPDRRPGDAWARAGGEHLDRLRGLDREMEADPDGGMEAAAAAGPLLVMVPAAMGPVAREDPAPARRGLRSVRCTAVSTGGDVGGDFDSDFDLFQWPRRAPGLREWTRSTAAWTRLAGAIDGAIDSGVDAGGSAAMAEAGATEGAVAMREPSRECASGRTARRRPSSRVTSSAPAGSSSGRPAASVRASAPPTIFGSRVRKSSSTSPAASRWAFRVGPPSHRTERTPCSWRSRASSTGRSAPVRR